MKVSVALAATAVVAVLAAPAGARRMPAAPALRIAKARPFVVAGVRFQPGERVTVTLVMHESHVRSALVERDGSFAVDFGSVTFARCAGFAVVARGSSGDRALLAPPRPMCALVRPGRAAG